MAKLVKNTLFYTFSSILPQAVAFILLPLYTKYLSPEEYGIVNAMTVVQALIAVLFSLNIERSLIRMYFDYKDKEKIFLGTLSLTIGVLAIFMLILILLFKDLISLLFSEIDFYPFYFYTIIMTFAVTFSLVPKNYFRLKNDAYKYFYISLLELIVNTSFIVLFVLFLKQGALGVVSAKMIASLVLLPIFLWIILHISFKFDWKILKNCLKFSSPTIPTLFAAWILSQADKVFIAGYISLYELGIYSLSTRLASIVGLISTAFTMAYHPLFFELVNSDLNALDTQNKLRKINNAYIIFLLFFSFTVALFSRELIIMFLDAKYHAAYVYIPAIISTYIVGSISSTVLGAFFQQSKKMKADMVFGIIGASLTFLLNFALIKIIGLWGAIISNLLATIIIFIMLYNYAKQKCFFIPFNWKGISVNVLVFLLIIIIFNYLFLPDPILSIVIKLIIFLILFIGFYEKYIEDLRLITGMKLVSLSRFRFII